ncbi:MAG: acetylornithine/succinylornithine family transaminase [Verrucomicrobiaceae bacterium]|nr:acetylornithine/succinylornithine family transaminase [Verrucomicrobiaceae bacterium]
MQKMTTIEKAKKYAMPNYGQRDFVVSAGKGSYVFDENGKKYLDFGAGIAVTSVGHANARWVKAVAEQASTIAHCSNLYLTKPNVDLCEELVKRIGVGKILLCNSGTEANEALIKAARLHGLNVTGQEGKKTRIITAVNCFHGRTLGAVAATAQYKIQHGFAPLLSGFSYADFNDLKSFEKQMGDDVAAVLVEPIQGESGVTPATKDFLKGLRKLCDKYNAMLLFDEVQCGVARSGKFLACQKYGVKPDGVSMAKGLAGGFPIGAIWLGKKYQDLFTPGTHGTTFGGNPLACAASLATLKEIDVKKLADNATKLGEKLSKALKTIVKKYPQKLVLERGVGLMRAVVFTEAYVNGEVCKKLRENGLLLIPSGANGLRFLPALNVTSAEVDKALKIFEKTIERL